MFFIERKTNYWVIEQRFSNGAISYQAIPTPTDLQKTRDGIVLVTGQVLTEFKRADVVVPQGENLESFLVALMNPSPSISGGGGSGESGNYFYTSGNYNITMLEGNIVNTADGSNFRLPTVAPLIYGKEVTVLAGYNTVTILCDDPSGDNIEGEISIKMYPGEVLTFVCNEPNIWLYK